MEKRHQILGKEGAYEILSFLLDQQSCPVQRLLEEFVGEYGKEKVGELVTMLQQAWFLEPVNDGVRITEDGIEAALLTRVINGASLESVIDRLSLRLRSRYSLITKDVTGAFFQMLRQAQAPREILICSPWIRLDAAQTEFLGDLVRKGTKISAIIRPPRQQQPPAWRAYLLRTAKELVESGVELVQHSNVHTKLYIIESGQSSSAIFGSENLTGTGNTELALHISEETVLQKLIAYWNEVFAESSMIRRGDLDE